MRTSCASWRKRGNRTPRWRKCSDIAHNGGTSTFYRWESQVKEAMREALSSGKRGAPDAKDREIEQLKAELTKKRRIIAEVIEENLEMNQKTLRLRSRTRFTAREKAEVLELVSVLDAYSRYIVQWELLTSMKAADVRLVIQEAIERTGTQSEIVTHNGSQFTAKDFRALVRRFQLHHIRIRTYHPESNGRIERFHRSMREALSEEDLRNLTQARVIIGRWVEHYNEARLARGIAAKISETTIWRWLGDDALRPWYQRGWVFPRDPDFAEKAGRVLDLHAGLWQGLPLGANEFVSPSGMVETPRLQAKQRSV